MVLLLWIICVIYVLYLSCFRVRSLLPCGHLKGKAWPLGSCLWCLSWFCYFPIWYLGTGVVHDCYDSWSLLSFLLLNLTFSKSSFRNTIRVSNDLVGAQWLSGRVLDSRPRVRALQSSLRCGPWAWHIYPSLLLVPTKTSPCLTERLLMGHEESNQTNKWFGSSSEPTFWIKTVCKGYLVQWLWHWRPGMKSPMT